MVQYPRGKKSWNKKTGFAFCLSAAGTASYKSAYPARSPQPCADRKTILMLWDHATAQADETVAY
jgi:hypothetical protein